MKQTSQRLMMQCMASCELVGVATVLIMVESCVSDKGASGGRVAKEAAVEVALVKTKRVGVSDAFKESAGVNDAP